MSNRHHVITVRRRFNATRARVFAAFSNAESLTQWFSPDKDIAVELQEFEFVPQGRFRVRYLMPDGTRPVVCGVYERIDPPDQIVFSWRWQPPDRHADIHSRVLVEFLAQDTQTEVILTHEQLPQAACKRHVIGWQATLARLDSFLGGSGVGEQEAGAMT